MTNIKDAPEVYSFPEIAAPTTPPANKVYFYFKSDGKAYRKDDTGTETEVGGGNAGEFGTPSELTIASGAITVTGSYHTVDTEADAATDDLETINGGTTGQLLFLRAANTARTVYIRNNTGATPKIQNQYGDFALDNTEKAVVMLYDGTNWLALGMLSIPDMYAWGGNVDGTLEFAAWDSSGEVYYKVTGDEIQQLRTAIITADDSYNSQPSLQVEFDSATDRTLTINSGTVAEGHSIFAHALQVSGGTGHKILLPSGVTWDGTNRAALFNAVDDALIAGAISSTRYVIYSNTGVTFAAS